MSGPFVPVWAVLNPYGERVEESAQGHRRVATQDGWTDEQRVPAWRVCRAKTAEDVQLAQASMAVPSISQAFEHQPGWAYRVWRQAPGQPTPRTPPDSQDATVLAFARGVERALGDATTRAWAAHRSDTPGVPRWDRTLACPSATALRGLQWGLAKRLEAEAVAHPQRVWWEQGLVDAGDAATRRLPAERRMIHAERLGFDPGSPDFKLSQGWTPAPLSTHQTGGFRGQLAAQSPTPDLPPERVVILWARPHSWSALPPGQVEGWSRWFAKGGAGWLIAHGPPADAERALHEALKARPEVTCWRVTHGAETVARVWQMQGGPGGVRSLSLAQWAGDPPLPPPIDAAPEADEDGRVPYRPLSRVLGAEGVAPRRMEAGMHQALVALQQTIPDVDAWVAEGLGIAHERLLRGDLLSPEQIDAVALARHALEQGHGFLLADETGFGKGRVLAALGLTGLHRGHPVVFCTENANLFSDWFRDLYAVGEGRVPTPTLLHQAATVRLPNGTIVAKSNKKEAFLAQLKQKHWHADETPLVLSTYAQINRADNTSKVDWLKARLGPRGWLLLDEAHNAAGDSQVSANVAKLSGACDGVVFASATFARHEGNLDLYQKALPLPPTAARLLRRALRGDTGLLREALTQAMAAAGHLVRREHPPIPPPEPHWVPMTPERHAQYQAFVTMWQRLFEVTEAVERAQGGKPSQAWLKLGAVLSRSVREFNLLMKLEPLVEAIQARLAQDQKVVVAVDSTFEAALRESLLEEVPGAESSDGLNDDEAMPPPTKRLIRAGEGPPPRWKDRWNILLQAVAPPTVWQAMPANHPAVIEGQQAWQAARMAIDALPDWDLSPLDRIQARLRQSGVASGELSGRTLALSPTATGWSVGARKTPERHELVGRFNSGQMDVLFVTRAGCTGISLHAGKAFADQRVRCLIEWDIAPNPINRIQFWGRVRRKDQVREPHFAGLVLDTPTDRRIQEREDRKRRMLQAHLGHRHDWQVGWVSPEGEALVEEWGQERRDAARRIGVVWPDPENPIARIDRALVRSTVLPAPEQAALLERLQRGMGLVQGYARRRREDPDRLPSRVVRRHWWWGHDRQGTGDADTALGCLRLDAVERVWTPQAGPAIETVAEALQQARRHPDRAGPAVLERWKAAWTQERQQGLATTPQRMGVWQWVQTHLPGLQLGQGIQLSAPDTGRPTVGMVLGLHAPDAGGGAPVGASPWAPSQVGLEVWLTGDAEPLMVPLSVCAHDAAFRVSPNPADHQWFRRPLAPRQGLTIEGNPVLAAHWGRRWDMGRSVLIRDVEHGEQVVWALPAGWDWARLQQLPRDLIDVEHLMGFWKANPDAPVLATLPGRLRAQPTSKGVVLGFSPEAWQHGQAYEWMTFPLERLLGREHMVTTAEGLERHHTVGWSKLRQVLHMLEAAGIGWRIGPEHEAWYRDTSRERCASSAK